MAPEAGWLGMLAASGLWLVLWFGATIEGDRVLLMTAGAQRIGKEDAPQLWNIVEEMSIASGLGGPPDVYLIWDPGPNAFAVERGRRRSVAVTSGLLERLSRDELQGVIGHEIGHIRNRDSSFMTLAGVMLGAIVLLSEAVLRVAWWGGGRRRSSRGGHAAVFLAALAAAILAPFFARLLYLACSRRREHLADACAARFTRYPEGLASALEKIAAGASAVGGASRVLAPMYIINPLQSLASFQLFSTHPPTEERVKILRGMAGAGYSAYEEAFRRVRGGKRPCLDETTLSKDTPVPVRAPSVDRESREEAVRRAEEVHDLLGRLNGLVLLTCACGVKIKVPAEMKREGIPCPRCGRTRAVPSAQPVPAPEAPSVPILRYERSSHGWESFKCACGAVKHLSPKFKAPFVRCDRCGQKIDVVECVA